MAKLSTSSVFGDLLVDGTIFGNVTGNLTGNASTATSATTATSAGKWTTARTLTIGNTGKSVDGSGNQSWTLTEIGAAASDHKHGLLHNSLACLIANTTTDSGWSMLESSYNGFLLKSIRTQSSAPAWIQGNYGAGIAFGGGDTKAVISAAYGSPSVKFAGGNGSAPVWNMTITGTTGKSYNLNNFAASSHGTHVTYSTTTPKVAGTASVGSEGAVARGDHVHPLQTSVSGNAGTATKLATARNITVGNKTNSFDGTANISFTLSDIGAATASHTHNLLSSVDTRSVNSTPAEYNMFGIKPEFKYASTVGISNSGGNYVGLITYQQWADVTNWSGGKATQLAFGDGGNMYMRKGDKNGWASWKTVLDSTNYTNFISSNLTAVNSNFANATISNYDTVMNGINTNINSLK